VGKQNISRTAQIFLTKLMANEHMFLLAHFLSDESNCRKMQMKSCI